MGRRYVVETGPVAHTTNELELEIKSPAGKSVILRSFTVSRKPVASPPVPDATVSVKVATGSYTTGSGGSAKTLQRKISQSDAAPTATAQHNLSGAAAGTGTLTTLFTYQWNPESDFQNYEEDRDHVEVAGSSAIILRVDPPTTGSVTDNITATVEEIG